LQKALDHKQRVDEQQALPAVSDDAYGKVGYGALARAVEPVPVGLARPSLKAQATLTRAMTMAYSQAAPPVTSNGA
jgi:hypothetical protein